MAVLDLLKRRYIRDFVVQMKDIGGTRERVVQSAVRAMKDEHFLESLAKEQLKEVLDEVFGESENETTV